MRLSSLTALISSDLEHSMKLKNSLLPIASLIVLSVLFVTGCADSYQPPIEVISVIITGEAQPMMVGATIQLHATVTPSDATHTDIVWSSDNPAIASVDGSGLVTAVSHGVATISAIAKHNDKCDSVQIPVYNGYVNATFTNTGDSSDMHSFNLMSGPVEGSNIVRDMNIIEYEIPLHGIRDMSTNGSWIVASSHPMDQEYGNYIPFEETYPFDSIELFVPDAVDESCEGKALAAQRVSIERKTDSSTSEFFAAYVGIESPSISVMFTAFGDAYVEGTFSGSILDWNSIDYTVSGEFKVLRAEYLPSD